MKKLILFAMIFVVLLSTPILAETFQQGQDIDFTKTCTWNGTKCGASADCNITIRYEKNMTDVVRNGNMTNNFDGIFNYTIPSNSIYALGGYNWDQFCCDNGWCGEAHGDFLVTKTGVELSQDKAMVYLGVLAILVFLFLVSIGSLAFIPAGNTKDSDGFFISISNLKYIRPVVYLISYVLLMIIMFTSSNISFLYLETTMMGDILFNAYRFMMLMALPAVVLWFILIFVNIFRDREMKSMLERGVQIPSTP